MLNPIGVSSESGEDNPSVFAADLPCRSANPDLFFAESPADLERAKLLCAVCPIRTICLANAIERQEPWGVWGGEIFDQGVIIARKRPRGRPRKVAA
jgi:WhiB family redox-sensing transcriptional regulator